jgi:hypothetical protein
MIMDANLFADAAIWNLNVVMAGAVTVIMIALGVLAREKS